MKELNEVLGYDILLKMNTREERIFRWKTWTGNWMRDRIFSSKIQANIASPM